MGMLFMVYLLIFCIGVRNLWRGLKRSAEAEMREDVEGDSNDSSAVINAQETR